MDAPKPRDILGHIIKIVVWEAAHNLMFKTYKLRAAVEGLGFLLRISKECGTPVN